MFHNSSSSHARQTNLGPIRPKVSDLQTGGVNPDYLEGLPLAFLKCRCSASTPSAWRLVPSSRASCRSCRCSSVGIRSNTPFVSPVLVLLSTFERLRLSARAAPCTASARLDLRFAKGHDSMDPFE